MKLQTPHYYKNFKCIASSCKDNCCIGGWEIDIDEETAIYYKNVSGEFGKRLKDAITFTDEYCFKLNNGRCPFLDNNNLCEIYRELGEDKMGVVCTQFPRFTEYFGTVKETGIGLACEEAERIIFSDKEPFCLETSACDEESLSDGEYDTKLGAALFILRDKLFKLVELKNLKFTDKLIIMINCANELQKLINDNNYAAIDAFCNNFNYSEWCFNDGILDCSSLEASKRIWYPYLELELLNDDWKLYTERIFETIHRETSDNNDELYNRLLNEFTAYISPRIYEYENLIKYYLFRYFMKASFDYDVLGKIQLIAANFIIIRDMDILRWLDNGKNFDFQDRIDTVHIFSREVEYSQDNLCILNEEFMFDDIFKPQALTAFLSVS